MNPAKDHANQCRECGRAINGNRHFCNAECFERWMEDDKTGIHLTAGASILAKDRAPLAWEAARRGN
jgi:hypothetical protein